MTNLQRINILFIIFFGLSLFVYFLFNAGAFITNVWYDIYFNSPFISEDLRKEKILDFSKAALSRGRENTNSEEKKYELIIPKISVSTPIILPSSSTNKDILQALEGGVGLYPNSDMPGSNGRSVILGHSSKASWYKGNYAYIFSLLPKLEPGDEFYITSDKNKYTYRVFSKKTLSPQETNATIAISVSSGEVDLITCYPIGGASQRTLVQASLIKSEKI